MRGGVGIGDHEADIVTHQIDLVMTEFLDKFTDALGGRRFVEPLSRHRRVAEAGKVGGDDGVTLGQLRHDLAPHVPG